MDGLYDARWLFKPPPVTDCRIFPVCFGTPPWLFCPTVPTVTPALIQSISGDDTVDGKNARFNSNCDSNDDTPS